MIIKTKVSTTRSLYQQVFLVMSPVALLPPPMSLTSSSFKIGTAQQVQSLRRPLDATGFTFDSMEDALTAFAAGEFLVVMDDEDRENEGDLIISASKCTTEKMAWMIKHTRSVHVFFPTLTLACEFQLGSGYICIALPGERLEALQVPMMVPDNQERHRTAYTVTVDYKHGECLHNLVLFVVDDTTAIEGL